ncbi:amidohydrolase family protein [Mesorhizobium sp. 1M-11]|uniref:amidohydrolase family protein n=1 Tax=Mesorhizobium sp. 1M-11 TaxID=1529006 RepID=UPI000AE7DD7E|nr:amidohydrolase family protein [Mesorhizobium sp. 1M-11]
MTTTEAPSRANTLGSISSNSTMHDGRIDTHHHILPPAYAAWLDRHGIRDGDRPLPEWSVQGALDLMDDNGIVASILSVSTPGVHLGDGGEARRMARTVNEFTAGIVSRCPDRFGHFATLPLPDIDAALEEVAYAFDCLDADGIVLLGNVGGAYLGDVSLDPLMAELDRRRATILVHPCALPGAEVPGLPAYAADFLLDTTRAAINLARSGCLERFPNLKIILSHAGGFLPFAAQRLAASCSVDGDSEGGIARLKRFYFDTALSSSSYALPSLLSFAEPTHITFGSDWPFATRERSAFYRQVLDDYPLTEAQRLAIGRGNAERLLPRLATALADGGRLNG